MAKIVFAGAVWSMAFAAAAQTQMAPSLGAPTRLNLALVDRTAGMDLPRSSAVEAPVEPRTAVVHRFAPDGLVGSAGYLCGIGGIGPDSDEARSGPASVFGHFGTFLGATLAYPLR